MRAIAFYTARIAAGLEWTWRVLARDIEKNKEYKRPAQYEYSLAEWSMRIGNPLASLAICIGGCARIYPSGA
jgi:hypothetical protein